MSLPSVLASLPVKDRLTAHRFKGISVRKQTRQKGGTQALSIRLVLDNTNHDTKAEGKEPDAVDASQREGFQCRPGRCDEEST